MELHHGAKENFGVISVAISERTSSAGQWTARKGGSGVRMRHLFKAGPPLDLRLF